MPAFKSTREIHVMKANQKIVLSGLVAGMVAFTGCGGGGGDSAPNRI
jgi:hypothetical protein